MGPSSDGDGRNIYFTGPDLSSQDPMIPGETFRYIGIRLNKNARRAGHRFRSCQSTRERQRRPNAEFSSSINDHYANAISLAFFWVGAKDDANFT